MSDDEEMTDLSQAATQSGSYAYTSLSLSNKEPERDPWGLMIIHEITRKRLGYQGPATYQTKEVRRFELVDERTMFGRKGSCQCNISGHIDQIRVNQISGVHFTIIKRDVKDSLCPVFLEDSSQNGTFIRTKSRSTNSLSSFSNYERVDEKVKRRILAHKDVIYIEKTPTICFEFQSLQITPNELPEDINKEYHVGNILGTGACGTVYLAQNRKTCQPYAVKYTNGDGDENKISTIMKEVTIMKRLKHPCILKLFKVQSYVDSVAILLEFMKGGDLITRIQAANHFSESLTKFIFYQICCGVQYLHDQNVTHRDLKPENILLATMDEYTLVKVSDFGLSKVQTNSVLQTQCGTRMYMAPELHTARYTNKVDVWSLGVILFNCFTGRYPFYSSNNYDLKFKPELWNEVSEDGKNIVRETLQVDAGKRPSCQQLISQRNWLSKNDQNVRRARDIIDHPPQKQQDYL